MRQLAAIVFVDMVGYTALMQENEQLARELRKKLKDALEKMVGEFSGKILQNYGDGSLSIFNSAIDAVRCSIELQQNVQTEPRVDVRIGIHTGDVTVEDEAIYGDGVNLASRIESMGVPGSILISEKVFDEIRNQQSIKATELGYFEFKNIRQPVRVFAIANNGILVPGRDELKGKTKKTENRLAVLPFVNMSSDPENEYFSDGITEELLNALTRVDGLQVTSRTSSFAFKGKLEDIRNIGIQLNVDKVLEGSVRKSGNRVRVTAQLINAADGYHIWSETYDRNLTDIFEVQDEISAIISNKLRENLTANSKEEQKLKPVTKNMVAYSLFLKGKFFWHKLTPADARKAIECWEKAIQEEPDYAEAYAMIAAAHSYLGASGQINSAKAFEIVKRYADKSLELNPSLAEGYLAKASMYLYYDWNWDEAYKALRKGQELNPSIIEAYELLSFYYVIMDRIPDAVKIMEEAEQIDPLSPIVIQQLGITYMFADRYDEAIAQANKLLEMDPNMRAALESKAWAIGMKGDWKSALPLFEQFHRMTNHPLKGLMGLGFAYGQLGMRDQAMECVRKLEQRQVEEPEAVLDADLAAVWYSLGDLDKTFYYLNKTVDRRMAPANYYLQYPAYRGLKSDPRYQELMKRTATT